jgi:hypothetical protein
VTRFKTVIFWIFLVLALGVGVYGYFSLKKNKKPQLDALSVIPDHCLVYLNTTNFFELNKKINSQSLIADKLKLFGDINLFCNTIQSFDSLFNSDELIRDEIKDNPVHFACYKKNRGWLATFNIKQLGEQEEISERLAKILHAEKNKAGIYFFKMNKNTSFYFHLGEGVAALSNTEELIIQSLNKTAEKLENTKVFAQFKNTLTENSLLSIYVDHSLYSESGAASQLNLSYNCKSGYSAGAIDLQPSQIKINGYLKPGEAELISLFGEQKVQSSDEAVALLPRSTLFFKAYGFSSYNELRTGFPSTRIHIKFWMKANEKALYNVEDDFNNNVLNHLVDFETASSKQNFISLQIADTLKTAEHLKFMSDSVLKQEGFLVYKLHRATDDPLQLFIPLSGTTTHYALLYQSHIFFAENNDKLIQVAKDLENGNLLTNNESFASYKNQHFADDFNYLLYNSPNQIAEDIPSFFNFKTTSQKNPFENFKHFSFSVSNNKNNFKFRMHLMNVSESGTKERGQGVLWTLNLDSASTMQASGFVNHNTNENEIVLQDNNNVVYLVNAKGTVLWKKKINEKILSEIYMVDIYKKNKYQLLFNTKNYLHLVDRNGNYVEKYPVKLPAEASTPLSLFDYEGDKDYRILIACKNKTIYNYSIHGMAQEKFTPVKTDNEVTLPVQYAKVGSSDYLVALDREGRIYTFSRKGVGRIGLRNRTVANCKAFYADAGNSVNSSYLVYVDDKNGLINKISFDDKKEIVKLNTEIDGADVRFSLVDDNRSMDLVITKNNSLLAYNFSGNLIVEKSAPVPLGRTNYYSDESHSLFYSLSEDQKEILIFDQLKSKTETFKATALPLISNLFKDNKKYLIITNGRQLNCVLLD